MKLCVYCGSSSGNAPQFEAAAVALGDAMAHHRFDLVYGGASIGLMGRIADTVLAHGGEVHGVMPRALADKEIAHPGLTGLHITTSMHDRKAQMADLCDAFLAMPGGLGTLEELFESWTWAQLGFHQKPVALLNTGGYFDHLIDFLDQGERSGFIKPAHRKMLIVSDDPSQILTQITAYQPPRESKLS